MKTLKFEIQTIFAERFTGHPSREDEDDIRKLKESMLLLAEAIDNLGDLFDDECSGNCMI